MQADAKKVGQLIKTARGQLDGVLKMIAENRYCMDIANQLSAAESILHRARREVLKAHLDGCVQDAFQSEDLKERQQKLDEILDLIDKCSS